jgi:hypothetical protein
MFALDEDVGRRMGTVKGGIEAKKHWQYAVCLASDEITWLLSHVISHRCEVTGDKSHVTVMATAGYIAARISSLEQDKLRRCWRTKQMGPESDTDVICRPSPNEPLASAAQLS